MSVFKKVNMWVSCEIPTQTYDTIKKLIKGSEFTPESFISAVIVETVEEYRKNGGKAYADK